MACSDKWKPSLGFLRVTKPKGLCCLSMVSNREEAAFLTDLAFLRSAPSYSTAKLKEEEEEMEGGVGLCPWRLNCCEYNSQAPSAQHETIRHWRALEQKEGSGCLSRLPWAPRTIHLSDSAASAVPHANTFTQPTCTHWEKNHTLTQMHTDIKSEMHMLKFKKRKK